MPHSFLTLAIFWISFSKKSEKMRQKRNDRDKSICAVYTHVWECVGVFCMCVSTTLPTTLLERKLLSHVYMRQVCIYTHVHAYLYYFGDSLCSCVGVCVRYVKERKVGARVETRELENRIVSPHMLSGSALTLCRGCFSLVRFSSLKTTVWCCAYLANRRHYDI